MPPYVWLVVFHPILITLLALIALVLLLRWTGWWARYKYRILLVLLAAYVIDAAFALPRIVFAYGLSKGPQHCAAGAAAESPCAGQRSV
jgi:hypothetical protein